MLRFESSGLNISPLGTKFFVSALKTRLTERPIRTLSRILITRADGITQSEEWLTWKLGIPARPDINGPAVHSLLLPRDNEFFVIRCIIEIQQLFVS